MGRGGEVIVLAACADALQGGRGAAVAIPGLFESDEDLIELHHSGVGETRRFGSRP